MRRLLFGAAICAVATLARRSSPTEGFIARGSLGLDGHVGAWMYFNDDRYVDAVVISPDKKTASVHLWDHVAYAFEREPVAVAHVDAEIQNIVAGDFSYDGHADLLLMTGSGSGALDLVLFFGANGTLGAPTHLPASAAPHPLALDASGDLHIDLLGHPKDSRELRVWRNLYGAPADRTIDLEELILVGDNAPPACRLAHPHSSAFVDLNGDCLADLFLECEASGGQRAYQIWTAERDEPLKYRYARSGLLPRGAGALAFADMNRDGTIDVVFATCDGQCHINIAYNHQVPLCAPEKEGILGAWDAKPPARCRDAYNLCSADDEFTLSFELQDLARISAIEATGDLHLKTTNGRPDPLRVGDLNSDGYPEVLVLSTDGRTRVHALANTACVRTECAVPGGRILRRVRHQVFDGIPDIESVALVDLDSDGSLDVLVQSKVAPTFVINNNFHDSFFLKALTLNAACPGRCDSEITGDGRNATAAGTFKPWGASLGGATYKFTVLDPNGVRRAHQVAQQAQNAYGALLPPGATFGLGRTNNYVEVLFVGSTRRQRDSALAIEGVVPNSEVIIVPWQGRPEPPGAGPAMWRRELYLHPAEWIHLVVIVLGVVILLLLGVVGVLDLAEKREDERERRRAVHAINFDAL
ncbi:hypothetical protein MCUN1_001192 [Malassezia cuniculi]|uniref:T-cell immunomodulatory protein TIP C2 domain-containing protein n=1 Tax=Malassezia cuniculi TaxID=948313 RepID=A0AAF0EPB3_9BASI|nr:hypothetical protein MCUN1_001192 [Malassezia cuniculi]